MRCLPKNAQQAELFVGIHSRVEVQVDKAICLRGEPTQKQDMAWLDGFAQRLHLHDKQDHTDFHQEMCAPQSSESRCCALVRSTPHVRSCERVVLHLLDQVLVSIVQLRWPNADGWLAADAAQTNHAATCMYH